MEEVLNEQPEVQRQAVQASQDHSIRHLPCSLIIRWERPGEERRRERGERGKERDGERERGRKKRKDG